MQVYTRSEAEDLLKISQSTMMRLIKKGVVRAAKVGGHYRILGADLLRLFLPESGYLVARDIYRESRKVIHKIEGEVTNQKKEDHV